MRRPLRILVGTTTLALVAAACSYQSRAVLPETPTELESSTLVSADGTPVYTFHAEENRKVVPLEEIPLHVRNAVVAIEDERFYRHNGVDLRAVLRALEANTSAGGVEEGGSTITQQYVKKVVLRDDSQTLSRKIEEASMAVQLERRYSKERILELYLNAIYFGNGAYGIEAAARQYFAKPVTELTLAEGALLAGLIQRPSGTDPYNAPDVALERRNVVLERMREHHFAASAEVDVALAEPLTLGSATTPAAERYAAPYFVEEVKQWILDDPRFGATAQDRRDLLFGGGLRIQTTLDLAAQASAEAAATTVLPNPNGPAVALVSVEPTTGYVRAMVGGRDFFGTGPNDKLNLATQGGRPSGSSFKPFTLAAALEEGIDAQTTFPAPACLDIPLPDAPAWHVCNAEGGNQGATTIVEGTVHSYNTLYAQLVLRVGPEKLVATAEKLGVRSPLDPNLALVLGTDDVTTLDMASAYATFANRGIQVPPVLVTRITRADGTLLFQHEHTQTKVLSTDVADAVTAILEQVIQRGTGTRAQLDRAAAGKTGTVDDYKDAWFVGYTPELATAVWVGFPGAQVSMRPPTTAITVFGGTYPAQVWQRFMSAALTGRPVTPFPTTTTTSTTLVPRSETAPTTTARRAPTAVPDVVGGTAEDAARVLQEAGFVVKSVPAASGQPGRVIAQAPAGGSTAPAGSTVRIEVAPNPGQG
jgi:penicillin-binding protein 1A